jgi:P27 family predicted phage terminase small subunit
MPGTKRSGRRPKPTELKVIEGTFRKDRHGAAPVTPPGGFPEAPEHLTPEQAKLWAGFPRVGWIAPSDALAVEGVVTTYDLCRRNAQAQGATPEAGNPLAFKVAHDSDGGQTLEPKQNPLVTQHMQLWARMFSMLAALGLTPADRAKMQAPKQDEKAEDKWAGLL